MSDYKILSFQEEARSKLASGADILSKAVVSTLGPRSRNVALNSIHAGPTILHDGVSVAREIRLKDPFEDMGAVLVREAASRTNDLAGDGTTTATLIANALVQNGLKIMGSGLTDGVIQSGSINPMLLKEELDKYAALIIEKLDARAKQLTKRKDYEKVAIVSCASEMIGKLVADAIEKVGKDGVIMVEKDASLESSLEIQQGMEFENGYLSPYFVTDPDRMLVEYSDGYVLATDHNIFDAEQLVPIVTKVMNDSNKPLLIIADDVVGPALQALVLTKLNPKTRARIVAVVAPEFADRRKEMLEDIALLTGGSVVAKDLDKKIQDVEIKDLGRFRSIKVTQTHTTITPKNPDAEEIKERVNAIKKQIDEEKNDFRKSRLEYRLGKLSSGVAIIKIGGASDTEIKERYERAIDAVHATKAALAEGVVIGGGMTLYNIAQELSDGGLLPEESNVIRELVVKTLEAPFDQLMINAGEDHESVKNLIKTLSGSVKNCGYDLVGKRAGDMYEFGIVDPVKVTKLAVRHGFSVAGMILTTNTLVSDDPDQDRNVQKVKPV